MPHGTTLSSTSALVREMPNSKNEDVLLKASQDGARRVGQLGSVLGILLIIQGVSFYFLTSRKSVTAAIPSFVGVPLLVASLMMTRYSTSTKALSVFAHIAVVVSLLGFLGGSGMGYLGFAKTKELSTTVADCLIMAVLCVVHVVASVKHFMKIAKLKRAAKNA